MKPVKLTEEKGHALLEVLRLTPQEIVIMLLRQDLTIEDYSKPKEHKMTLREVGALFGVSGERIRSAESKGKRKLRRKMKFIKERLADEK